MTILQLVTAHDVGTIINRQLLQHIDEPGGWFAVMDDPEGTNSAS